MLRQDVAEAEAEEEEEKQMQAVRALQEEEERHHRTILPSQLQVMILLELGNDPPQIPET